MRADEFIELAHSSMRLYIKPGAGRTAEYKEAEDALYNRFIQYRREAGIPVDHYWLRAQMEVYHCV